MTINLESLVDHSSAVLDTMGELHKEGKITVAELFIGGEIGSVTVAIAAAANNLTAALDRQASAAEKLVEVTEQQLELGREMVRLTSKMHDKTEETIADLRMAGS